MANQTTTSTRDSFTAAVEPFNPNSVGTASQYDELRRSLSGLPLEDKAVLRRNMDRIMNAADIVEIDDQKAAAPHQDNVADPGVLPEEIKPEVVDEPAAEAVPPTQPVEDKPVLPDVEKIEAKIDLKPLHDDIKAYKEFSDDVVTRSATAGDGATKRTVETDRVKLDEQKRNIIADFRKLAADGVADDVLKPILAELKSDKLDIPELDEALNDVRGHDKLMKSLEGKVFTRKEEKVTPIQPEVSNVPAAEPLKPDAGGDINPTLLASASKAAYDEPVEAAQFEETAEHPNGSMAELSTVAKPSQPTIASVESAPVPPAVEPITQPVEFGPAAENKSIEPTKPATAPEVAQPDQVKPQVESTKSPAPDLKTQETASSVPEINKNPLEKWLDLFSNKRGDSASYSKAMPGSEPKEQTDKK